MADQPLHSCADLERFVGSHRAAAVYFSGSGCGVCEALLPKLRALLAERFPRLPLALVPCDEARELAAASQVFSIPTVLIYFDGRESLRKVRSFSLEALAAEIARPYGLLFD